MSEESNYSATSQLFTVRLWVNGSEQAQRKWRGKVQHVSTGAWRYFRDWEGLVAFLATQGVDNDTE